MPKYHSEKFRDLFNTFKRMFQEEGDIYESTKKGIEEDIDHSMISSTFEKKIVLNILKDAAIDYYKSNINIISEEEFIKEILIN